MPRHSGKRSRTSSKRSERRPYISLIGILIMTFFIHGEGFFQFQVFFIFFAFAFFFLSTFVLFLRMRSRMFTWSNTHSFSSPVLVHAVLLQALSDDALQPIYRHVPSAHDVRLVLAIYVGKQQEQNKYLSLMLDLLHAVVVFLLWLAVLTFSSYPFYHQCRPRHSLLPDRTHL